MRLRLGAGLALVAWAVWAALLLAGAFRSGPPHGDPGPRAAALVLLGALVTLSLALPRLGGVLLLLAGMAAAAATERIVALLALATPAVVLGAVHVLLGCIEPNDVAGGNDANMVS